MSISECEPIALATGSEYTDFSRLLADRQYATLANAIVSVGFTPKRPDRFDLFACPPLTGALSPSHRFDCLAKRHGWFVQAGVHDFLSTNGGGAIQCPLPFDPIFVPKLK